MTSTTTKTAAYASLAKTEIETVPSAHAPNGTIRRYFVAVEHHSVQGIIDSVTAHHKALGERAAVCFATGMRGVPDRPGHIVALVY